MAYDKKATKKYYEKHKDDPEYKAKAAIRRKRYYEKNKERIQEKQRDYWNNKRDKEKSKARTRQYYLDNKEVILARSKKYYEENKEKSRNYQAKHYEENKDSYRENSKKWNKKNPDKVKASKKEYRAKKFQAPSEPWTPNEIAAAGTGKCPYCGRQIGIIYDSSIMHIDHVIPLSRGGTNLIENLEPVCVRCNLSKSNKTKEEFLKTVDPLPDT